MYEKLCFNDNKSTPSLWETQYVCVSWWVDVFVRVSVCVCQGDTIVRLASGSSRVMQKLLVALLIPLCQCHKKHHQSLETGGPDHPPLLVSLYLLYKPRSKWEDY